MPPVAANSTMVTSFESAGSFSRASSPEMSAMPGTPFLTPRS